MVLREGAELCGRSNGNREGSKEASEDENEQVSYLAEDNRLVNRMAEGHCFVDAPRNIT